MLSCNGGFNLTVDATNGRGEVRADLLITGVVTSVEELAAAHVAAIIALKTSAIQMGSRSDATEQQREAFTSTFLRLLFEENNKMEANRA